MVNDPLTVPVALGVYCGGSIGNYTRLVKLIGRKLNRILN
jgi:hypothetical protein